MSSLHRTLCVHRQPIPQTHPTKCVLSIVNQLINYIKKSLLEKLTVTQLAKTKLAFNETQSVITEFTEFHHMTP